MSHPQPSTQGIYVHVPWCKRRCPYCAFYVEVDRATPWERWADGVLRDWQAVAAHHTRETTSVFLGGGTPSRTPGHVLKRLLDGLPRAAHAEVTAETNPEDAAPAWLDAALAAGVNRLSIGLQTFNPDFARLLNRACSVADAHDMVKRVGSAGFASWSVDLIFALPGQTVADLQRDLDAILATSPPHVSLYGLTYEPGTPFDRARERGVLTEASDDLWREMYDLIVSTLQSAGLERYEVSNFARPGHRSQHNRGYWQDRPYAGLGPSAHGYTATGERYKQVRDVVAWLAGSGEPAWEAPSREARATDLLVSGLRGVEGITHDHLHSVAGAAVSAALVAQLAKAGLLADDPQRLRLGFDGFPLADAVIARLVDSLEFRAASDTPTG